jgi:hypothetical protein
MDMELGGLKSAADTQNLINQVVRGLGNRLEPVLCISGRIDPALLPQPAEPVLRLRRQ